MNPAEFANLAKAERQFWWHRGMQRIMLGLMDPLVSRRRIRRGIDAGCGTGYFARMLEQRYEFPVVPADRAREGLEHGRKAGARRLTQCDAAALPFADGSFGLSVSLDVLGYLDPGAEEHAVREMARVLAPEGLMVLRVPALDMLRSRHSEFTRERQRFTRARLKQMVRGAGIRILRCTYANTLLFPLAVTRFRVWEPLFQKKPASASRPLNSWLDSALHAPLKMESRVLLRGWNLPLGQTLILIGEKTN
jgi:SAM-dependent methyltransferase